MSYADCEVTIELEVETNKGRTLTTSFDRTFEGVPCDTWTEECHGYHTMYAFDDDVIDERIQEFKDDLSFEELEEYFECELDEDEKIIKLL